MGITLGNGKSFRATKIRLRVDDRFTTLRFDVQAGCCHIDTPGHQGRDHRAIGDNLGFQFRNTELFHDRTGYIRSRAGNISVSLDVTVWRLVGDSHSGIALFAKIIQRTG